MARRAAGATLSQMLFDGFAVKSEVTRQHAPVDSSASAVAATAEDIALRTAGAYLEVLRRQRPWLSPWIIWTHTSAFTT